MTTPQDRPATAVLFVDDEANILKSLRRLLMDEPYEVFTAGSGLEGLKLLLDNPHIGLIVSDQRMPGMSGVDFEKSREIRPRPSRSADRLQRHQRHDRRHQQGRGSALHHQTLAGRRALQVIREALQRYELAADNRRLAAIVSRRMKN